MCVHVCMEANGFSTSLPSEAGSLIQAQSSPSLLCASLKMDRMLGVWVMQLTLALHALWSSRLSYPTSGITAVTPTQFFYFWDKVSVYANSSWNYIARFVLEPNAIKTKCWVYRWAFSPSSFLALLEQTIFVQRTNLKMFLPEALRITHGRLLYDVWRSGDKSTYQDKL